MSLLSAHDSPCFAANRTLLMHAQHMKIAEPNVMALIFPFFPSPLDSAYHYQPLGYPEGSQILLPRNLHRLQKRVFTRIDSSTMCDLIEKRYTCGHKIPFFTRCRFSRYYDSQLGPVPCYPIQLRVLNFGEPCSQCARP